MAFYVSSFSSEEEVKKEYEKINKGEKMKKFKAVDEAYQRVYYEAVFEAKDEDDAERMVADGMVTWNETYSKLDDNNVTIEEMKNEG